MKDFPSYNLELPNDVQLLLRYIVKERPNDVKEFDNIQNRFMAGRKVAKVPSGAATVTEDRIGDFNYDQDYFYIVVNNSGTAEWRRIAYTAW